MAFQFRFKVLMQQREFLRIRAQTELAAAIQRHADIEAAMQLRRNEIGDHRQAFEDRQKGPMSAAEYLVFNDYLRYLEQDLLHMEFQLKDVAREIEKSRSVLIEREKECRIMESLREKDWELYRYNLMRKEQRQTDEIACIADSRKKE